MFYSALSLNSQRGDGERLATEGVCYKLPEEKPTGQPFVVSCILLFRASSASGVEKGLQ